MTASCVLAASVQLRQRQRGRRQLEAGALPPQHQLPPGRVPRVARLMALAIKLDGLVRGGVVRDYAALARLGHVSRARITQIMNLLLLAPDIQEDLLFLPQTQRGRDPIRLRQLQAIALVPDWKVQRPRWRRLLACALPSERAPSCSCSRPDRLAPPRLLWRSSASRGSDSSSPQPRTQETPHDRFELPAAGNNQHTDVCDQPAAWPAQLVWPAPPQPRGLA